MARSLVEQVEILRSVPAGALAHDPPAWVACESGPWPVPHEPIFDFTTTPTGFEWLNRLAEEAVDVLPRRTAPEVIGKSLLTDDVEWSLPGKSLMSGEAHGVDAILRRSEMLQQYGVKIDVEHVVYGYQDVALGLHNTGERGGKILDEYLATVFRLQGNKIHRIDTFLSDVNMLDTYFV